MEHAVQPSANQDQKREKKDRKAQQKLTKQLHSELTKNVELHSHYNRVMSILKRINSQNQDLLEALVILDPDFDVPPAPSAAKLSPEQEEFFQALHN